MAEVVSFAMGAQVREVEFLYKREGKLVPGDQLDHEDLAYWTLPPEMLAERRLGEKRLIIIRAPEGGDGFAQQDRLLLNRDDRSGSPPGLHLLYDGFGLRAARCGVARGATGPILRIEGRAGATEELRLGEEIEIIGRLVATWEWL